MVKLGNVRGKSITLKVMVRAEDASTETAKFLGHGICDSFSRSANLSSFTNDSEVILREVMYLLRQLKGKLQMTSQKVQFKFKYDLIYWYENNVCTLYNNILGNFVPPTVDVKDLRGLGIQVSKLDSTNCSKNEDKSSTKSILHFVKKIDPNQPPPERTEKGIVGFRITYLHNSRLCVNRNSADCQYILNSSTSTYNFFNFKIINCNI